MKIKIEKGIKLPVKGFNSDKTKEVFSQIDKMDIGDSFLVENKEYQTIYNAIRLTNKKTFKSRKTEKNSKVRRFWRIA